MTFGNSLVIGGLIWPVIALLIRLVSPKARASIGTFDFGCTLIFMTVGLVLFGLALDHLVIGVR